MWIRGQIVEVNGNVVDEDSLLHAMLVPPPPQFRTYRPALFSSPRFPDEIFVYTEEIYNSLLTLASAQGVDSPYSLVTLKIRRYPTPTRARSVLTIYDCSYHV